MYAIKTEVSDAKARSWTFDAQKTMYGGKHAKPGDLIFVFASENEGGVGLVACGTVSQVEAAPLRPDIERQTPRISIVIDRIGPAKRRLGRVELKTFNDWNDRRPETELNFKLYRQATDKIVGLSPEATEFLRGFF